MKYFLCINFLFCVLNVYAGFWTEKDSIPAERRYACVGFSIGNKGYVGTGFELGTFPSNDFWEWDQATDSWTQKADVPGPARVFASGFSIGNKGYIGVGRDDNGTTFSDFWEWDQSTNTWSQKENFPLATKEAVGFSIGNKGYISGGYNYQDQFWEYDP